MLALYLKKLPKNMEYVAKPQTPDAVRDAIDDRLAVLVSKFNPYVDLYVSSKLCEAFLITAATSTFGWWLAFFAPGQDAVYYMPDTKPHSNKRASEELFL
ncbi:hypothetical protein ANCCEY_05083 [Ancylostoma ceylanicum]|uniref:Uncharacterized protein n=1 Tax=Ancylostoma ceylanicum TaxID=53326 RepID=A0A0D6LXC9_9BILA|nr:hypothetical protein ANCCEY_05083 [Ancylostoma ceylanicum]